MMLRRPEMIPTHGIRPFRTLPLILALVAWGCTDSLGPGTDLPALFSEDFESGLAKWTGRSTGHHAQIVQDPLNAGNSVVNFTRTVAAGDLFSLPLTVDVNAQYTVTFDYLGLPQTGSTPNNLGGFLGIGDDIPGDHYWLYGPLANPAEHQLDLVEDGTWHSYSVTFTPAAIISSDGTIRIMIEDGEGTGAVPGDAYFDNIELRPAN